MLCKELHKRLCVLLLLNVRSLGYFLDDARKPGGDPLRAFVRQPESTQWIANTVKKLAYLERQTYDFHGSDL
jgi:hypothetical protein